MKILRPNTNRDGTIRGIWHVDDVMRWAESGQWFRVNQPWQDPRRHTLCCHVPDGPTMLGDRGWYSHGGPREFVLSIFTFYEPGDAPWWTNPEIPMNRLLAEIEAEQLPVISASLDAWLDGWKRKRSPVTVTMPTERGLRITGRNRGEDVLAVPAA